MIAQSTNENNKRKKFLLLLELISANKELNTSMDDEHIINLLTYIIQIQLIFRSLDEYGLLKHTFLHMLSSLANTPENTIYNLITSIAVYYSKYFIALLMKKYTSDQLTYVRFLLKEPENANFAYILALAEFFECNKLDELQEGIKTFYNDVLPSNNITRMIKDISSMNELQQSIVIKMIQNSFHFYSSDEAMRITVPVLNEVIQSMHKGSASFQLLVIKMFASMPIDCGDDTLSIEAQLTSILVPICEHLPSYFGEYAENLLIFVRKRDKCSEIAELIEFMFSSPKTSRAAIFLSIELKLFQVSQKLIEAAFPPPPIPIKRAMFSIEAMIYIIKQKKMTPELFTPIAAHFYIVCSQESLTSDQELHPFILQLIPLFVNLYNVYPAQFIDASNKGIYLMQDRSIQEYFADNFANVDTHEIEAPSLTEQFVEVFSRLAIRFAAPSAHEPNYERLFHLLRIFKPQETKIPKNVAEFIDTFMTSQLLPHLKKFIFSKLNQIKHIAVICAAVPGLNENELGIIINSLIEGETIIPNVFSATILSMSVRYLDYVLTKLEELGNMRNNTSFLAFRRKMREHLDQLNKSILLTIPKLVTSCKASAQQQTAIYRVISATLPDADHMSEMAKEASKIIDVFPLLSLAFPPPELIKTLIVIPLFAEVMPQLLSNVKGNRDMVVSLMKSWTFHLSEVPLSISMNQQIAELAFKLVNNEETTTISLNEISPYLINDPLPFIDLALHVINTSKKYNFKIDGKIISSFLIPFSQFCLSHAVDLRVITYKFFAAVFSNEMTNIINEVGLELPVDYMHELFVSFFTKIFATAPETLGYYILDLISLSKEIKMHHVLMLRSIFVTRSESLGKICTKQITKILANKQIEKGQTTFQCIKAFQMFAKNSMSGLLPILFTGDNNEFKSLLVNHILYANDLRQPFLASYHLMISNLQMNDKSLNMFSILPIIIKSEESPEISAATFSTIFTDLLVWITLLYSVPSTISKSQISEIENCYDLIFSRTQFAAKPQIKINASDYKGLLKTIETLTRKLSELDLDKIQAVSRNCYTFLNSSVQPIVLIGGVFFVNLVSIYGIFTNESARQFTMKLFESISKSFQAANNETRRRIAFSMREAIYSSHLKNMSPKDATIIFASLLDSLAENGQLYRTESTMFFSTLIEFVQQDVIDLNSEKLLSLLKITFDSIQLSIMHINLLSFYIKGRARIEDFSTKSRLNLSVIIGFMFNDRPDIREKTKEIIARLEESDETKSIIKMIFKTVDKKEFALLGSTVVKKIEEEELTLEWLRYLCDFNDCLINIDLQEVAIFKNDLVRLLLKIMSGSDSEVQHKAVQLLNSIVH